MKTIEINASNEFHLLRHFTSVSEEYLQTLIGQSFKFYDHSTHKFSNGILDNELVNQALKTKGSKFFVNVKGISNPKELLKLINKEFESKSQDNIKWEINGDKKFYSYLINYSLPVGFKNLIALSSLSTEEQSRVKLEPRGFSGGEESILIKTISNVDAKPINTIEVGLTDFEELPFYFVTAYPGDLEITPDFPNSNQTADKYESSKDYWDNHVFVI